MGLALFAFIAIFSLIGSAGLLLFYREAMLHRLALAIAPQGERKSWLKRLKANRPGDSIRAIVKPFDKFVPKSPQEVSIAQNRLIRAGYRDDSHLRLFYGAKVLLPLLLCIVVAVSGMARHSNPFFTYVPLLGLGYLAPDFWLGNRIKTRQLKIRLGLPDFLDLMVVCIEVGLSLDQALSRCTDELRKSQPELGDEMGLVNMEQRAGRPRADAWKNLAERVDIEVVSTMVSAINQADQFGTSVAKNLRIYAEGLRVKRRQQVEEMTAKTAVKLVFPLVFFIFPTLFIVALGPTFLAIGDWFDKFLK